MRPEVVFVRGGALRLGHHSTLPHGRVLLHPECCPHRGYSAGGGVHRPAQSKAGYGGRLPSQRPQLLDSRPALPGHALYIRPTVLDEQQEHL